MIALFIFGLTGFLATLIFGFTKIYNKNGNVFEKILIIVMAFGSWFGFLFLYFGYRIGKLRDEYDKDNQ